MQFNLTEEDMEKVSKFNEEQNEKVYKKQVKKGGKIGEMASLYGKAYYGAIGGELTFSFTPTGLGCVITVKHGVTGEELDLTNTDEW